MFNTFQNQLDSIEPFHPQRARHENARFLFAQLDHLFQKTATSENGFNLAFPIEQPLEIPLSEWDQ